LPLKAIQETTDDALTVGKFISQASADCLFDRRACGKEAEPPARLIAIQNLCKMYGMNKKKFTVRVGEGALEAAKAYAEEHNTTLTELVDAYFRSIQQVREINTDTPILQKLAGSLRPDASLEDYYTHLEHKYLGASGTGSE
jgi:hypothetical protein